MKILWTALILFINPTGELEIIHDPMSFNSRKQCVDYIEKAKGSGLLFKGCMKVIPGKDA